MKQCCHGSWHWLASCHWWHVLWNKAWTRLELQIKHLKHRYHQNELHTGTLRSSEKHQNGYKLRSFYLVCEKAVWVWQIKFHCYMCWLTLPVSGSMSALLAHLCQKSGSLMLMSVWSELVVKLACVTKERSNKQYYILAYFINTQFCVFHCDFSDKFAEF